MIWAFLSTLAGLGDAVSFAVIKKLSAIDIRFRLMFYNLITLPFFLFGFLFYEIPVVSLNFYLVVSVNALVWLIAMFLLMKSLQESDLSISIPLLSFTPIFLLFVSYILLQEFPTFLGLVGILIVVIGSYILHIPSVRYGYLEPFRAIFKKKGFYMIIVAFLFSITASLAKIGIQLSNPAYFMLFHYLFASIIMAALCFNNFRSGIGAIKKNFRHFIIIGSAVACSELMVAAALGMEIVPYVISLKRTSVIFSVLIGFFYFREKSFTPAIIGSAIMFAGALMIALS